MELAIRWSDKIKAPVGAFQAFSQKMANRLLQGHTRYGLPHKNKKYWTRLKLELAAYNRTGNAEHLINVANYCVLECEAPEHPKHHFNPLAISATRRE